MATPQELDARVINRWVLVHNTDDRLTQQKTHYGVEVDYFVGFVYVDQTAGMTINVESYGTVNGDTITLTKGPRDDNRRMMIRFTHAQPGGLQPPTPLTDAQQQALGLPAEPDWLQYYNVQGQAELDRIRQDSTLHPLRAPGFPDDIRFVLPPTRQGMQGEVVWGRVLANPQPNIYIVRLLNQPNQDFGGIKQGDMLVVQVQVTENGVGPMCVGRVQDE